MDYFGSIYSVKVSNDWSQTGALNSTITMFKKAKRANFRRRNESDEDEQDESQLPLLAPTSFGPVVEEIPFMETCSHSVAGAPSSADGYHSNGFQGNSVKAVKREKKSKEAISVPAGPTKASLLSFNDDEGEAVNQC